jgi:hypothetical protein
LHQASARDEHRRGALGEDYRQLYGQDGDSILLWQAATGSTNPAVDKKVIARAYERDESAAEAVGGSASTGGGNAASGEGETVPSRQKCGLNSFHRVYTFTRRRTEKRIAVQYKYESFRFAVEGPKGCLTRTI